LISTSLAPDGAALATAYTRYVEWMVREFHPCYLNVAVEMNLFLTGCSTGWDGLVQVERPAYDAAKSVDPSVVAFPSIPIDQLYAYMSFGNFYLSFLYSAPGIGSIAKIPPDWFTSAADPRGEGTVVAETGWISGGPTVLGTNGCFQAAIDRRASLRRARPPISTFYF
jgi:hypothetical protein